MQRTTQVFGMLARLLRPQLRLVLGSTASMVALAAVRLIPPYLTKIVIDHYIRQNRPVDLSTLLPAFLSILFLIAGLQVLQAWPLETAGLRFVTKLRQDLFEGMMRRRAEYHDRTPIGRMISHITSDVETISNLFTASVVAIFFDSVTIISILVAMMLLSVRLALIALCVLPIICGAVYWFNQRVARGFRVVRTLIGEMTAFLQQYLTGIETIQLYRREEDVRESFDTLNRAHEEESLALGRYVASFLPAIEVLGSVATALVLWKGGFWTLQGSVSLGALVACLQYLRQFYAPVADLSEKLTLWQPACAAIERFAEVLENPATEADLASSGSVAENDILVLNRDHLTSAISLSNVWFAYQKDHYVLKDVSFTVESGEHVALVGPSGSGKSTIFALLMGFYRPQKGGMWVNGSELAPQHVSVQASNIGLMMQDTFLFTGTIADNIRMANQNISFDAVAEAASVAGANTFIDLLPAGLNTTLTHGGRALSEGQRQMIALARLVLYDPQIVLLDEPTAKIDRRTERVLRDNLARTLSNRTVLTIAHRLSTIREASRIFVLNEGAIEQIGSHSELARSPGRYSEMWTAQFV